MDQGRGLEGLAGLLPGQPLLREPPQLPVDQREEFLGGPGVALLDRGEDAGDVVHGSRSLWAEGRPGSPVRARAPWLESRRATATRGNGMALLQVNRHACEELALSRCRPSASGWSRIELMALGGRLPS